jgi:DNA repair protein RecO (recombination protein O)
MPGLYEDEGVVLKTIKLGEADRIVTLFTRDNGKVRAVAKGVRKTKSRFGGRLEPFTRVSLLIYRGRSLDTITSVDVLNSGKGVRVDLARLSAAAVLADLVDKVTPEREPAGSVYSLLTSGLDAVAAYGAASTVPAFALKLLSISGYHPQLRVCAGCGERNGLEAFSPAIGGVVCAGCEMEDRAALPMARDRIGLLSLLLLSDFGVATDEAVTDELTNALRLYAEYHLERPLKSMRISSARP